MTVLEIIASILLTSMAAIFVGVRLRRDAERIRALQYRIDQIEFGAWVGWEGDWLKRAQLQSSDSRLTYSQIEGAAKFARSYCRGNGWPTMPRELTPEQLWEIHSQEGWATASLPSKLALAANWSAP